MLLDKLRDVADADAEFDKMDGHISRECDAWFKVCDRQMNVNRFPVEAMMSRVLVMLLIGALAASCTPGRIDYVHVDSSYDPIQYRFVPYTRAMYADVSGNPFPMEQQAFNTLVSEMIQPPGVVPTNASPYRIRLAFNGGGVGCGASGGGVRHGDITLAAALCPGGGPALTYLRGSVSDISGPDDPRFRDFVRFSVAKLFPAPSSETLEHENRERERHEHAPCFPPGC